mgnify:CR=1 FL=1
MLSRCLSTHLALLRTSRAPSKLAEPVRSLVEGLKTMHAFSPVAVALLGHATRPGSFVPRPRGESGGAGKRPLPHTFI